jgi:uncharacterized protein (TIGR00297 family)
MEGRAEDHFMILTGLFFSFIIAYGAFIGNWITLDATRSVMILGTVTLGFGGWWLAFAMIFFFLSSGLLTRRKLKRGVIDVEKRHIHHDLQKRRDGYQVWANGFWIGAFAIGWFITSMPEFLIAGFAVLATATADTWATEIGTLNPGKTRLISTFKVVEPGTDGGVSFKGTLAALFGSFAVALFVIPITGEPNLFVPVVFVAGFMGAIADSFAGSFIQKADLKNIKPEDFVEPGTSFKNSLVNWISTGVGGLISFIMAKIIFL